MPRTALSSVALAPIFDLPASRLAEACQRELEAALTRVDDHLFDLAEHAASTRHQAALVNALRALRRARSRIAAALRNALSAAGASDRMEDRLSAAQGLEGAILELDLTPHARGVLLELLEAELTAPPEPTAPPREAAEDSPGGRVKTDPREFVTLSLTGHHHPSDPADATQAQHVERDTEREKMSDDEANSKPRSAAGARIRAARDIADSEIDARLERHNLADLVTELLSNAWNNVLVLTLLRHGPQSKRYEEALSFADDLIWTSLPKISAADVARLQSMLPQLSRQLRSGLEMVAYVEGEIEDVFRALKGLYQTQIEERYRDTLHMPSVRSSAPLTRSDEVRPAQLRPVPLEAGAAAPSPGRRAGSYIRSQIDSLKPGAWLEFAGPGDKRIRAKLSWVSPISKKYLFVTDCGTKLADKTYEDLANEVASGETLLLESAPVFKSVLGPGAGGR
ncbi:MAG: DUF1631 family protein [Pseudomonadota bacterium]